MKISLSGLLYTGTKFNVSNRNVSLSLSTEEKKKYEKMEDNFIEKTASANKKLMEEGSELDVNTDPDSPYYGLTEDDAKKLEKMRDTYVSDIYQKKNLEHTVAEEKAMAAHNKEIDKIKSKETPHNYCF